MKGASDESFQPYRNGDLIAGKYEVRRVLGKGGFGIVYLVRLRETGEAFALKTFKDELTADPAALETFKKEALVWVNLERHPFILPAIWVEEIGHGRIVTPEDSKKAVMDARSAQEVFGRLLVIMDYVEADAQGRASLGDYLAGGPLDENQALKWAIQFCLGMEHARAHGVECHRDIKPANIMITRDGTLKVSDFGLSIATESACRETAGRIDSSAIQKDCNFGLSVIRTEGKLVCGTPGYIAPEVFRSEGASVQSDIYSFGLVLWQMAAGSPIPPFRVPWNGDIADYMRGVYEQQMSGRIPRLPGPLGEVIERCLQAKPSKRYGTFQEIRAVLEPILERKTGRKFEMPQSTGRTVAFWNNKGGALAALGRHEEAIRCYDTALEIEPRAPKVWNNKGSALIALGREDEALDCFDRALAIDPRFAMAFGNKGQALHFLGRLGEALHFCDQALSLDSLDAGAWHRKGSLLATMGKHADAIACYERALAITPKSLDSLYNKGLSLIRIGKETESLACLDQVLAINPGFQMAWINKGNLLAENARYEDAVSCFDRAIAIDSASAGAWAAKGTVLTAIGRVVDAFDCYDKALAIDAKNVVAWFGKGNSLVSSGNYSQALVCFERVLATKPNDAAALFEKAVAEEMVGRLSAAANTLSRFIEVAGPLHAAEIVAAKKHLGDLVRRAASKVGEQPGGKTITGKNWIDKAIALNESGRFAEAIECYDGALALDANNAFAWFGRGCALAKLQRHEDAVASYRNVVRLDPRYVAAWFKMGHSMGLLGRHKEVLRCCERALEIDPLERQAWILKGMGFRSMDRFNEALSCFQEAEKLGDTTAASYIANCRKAQAKSYCSLGYRYLQESNYAEAIACYEKGLALDTSNTTAWLNKGAALMCLQHPSEAVLCFDRAIALDPDDSSAWKNKGIALISLGQREDGFTCLIEANRLRRQNLE